MTGTVLVVDDVSVNRELLKAYLEREYFEVLTASNGQEALAICQGGDVELVILDVVMPGMDGISVCRRLKSDPRTHRIAVIMVTMLDRSSDRVEGFRAGADDFLRKPVSRVALVMRVKNLLRLKRLVDELRVRSSTSETIGLYEAEKTALEMSGIGARIFVVEDQQDGAEFLKAVLEKQHHVEVESDVQRALEALEKGEGDIELAIVSLDLKGFDALRLCSQMRSKLWHLPIIVIVQGGDEQRLLKALDMGINEYVERPVDENELSARVSMQVKRARYTQKLRRDFQQNVELSVTDELTGLYNRRYLGKYLKILLEGADISARALSILLCDVDFFKRINDTHGHDVGDGILRVFADRLRQSVRGANLVCRYGGEEFVIIFPDIVLEKAILIGQRLREEVEKKPFKVGDIEIPVTISVGIASFRGEGDDAEALFKRADLALYKSKEGGRNRVESIK